VWQLCELLYTYYLLLKLDVDGLPVVECLRSGTHLQADGPARNIVPPDPSIHRVKWRHRIHGHDTIAILWV